MSDIKSTITILCKHLKLLLNVNVKPEHFRLGKYDKTEDNVIGEFWQILYELCKEISHPNLDLYFDSVVSFVKLNFAVMEYTELEFYCLPCDMSCGSQELLLALAWLIAKEDALNKLTLKRIGKSELNKEFDQENLKITGTCDRPKYPKTSSLGDDLNYIMWLSGRINHNLKAINELDQEKVKFTSQIHQASINSCSLPLLSMAETKLVRHKELIPEYLVRVKEDVQLLETHKNWDDKCHLFWQWMESVFIEKEKNSKPTNFSIADKRTLLGMIHIVRINVKRFLNGEQDPPTPEGWSMSARRMLLDRSGKHSEIEKWLQDSETRLQLLRDECKARQGEVHSQLKGVDTMGEVIISPDIFK